jgi:MoxR-like ATPase
LVLRHRIMTNFHGEAEGITPDKIVKQLLEHVKEPRPEDYK